MGLGPVPESVDWDRVLFEVQHMYIDNVYFLLLLLSSHSFHSNRGENNISEDYILLRRVVPGKVRNIWGRPVSREARGPVPAQVWAVRERGRPAWSAVRRGVSKYTVVCAGPSFF